jgi:D-beta-D-heptose 7-phosphate kinase/D-beta-D-heptose 1-phosphate adenosyltransferase
MENINTMDNEQGKKKPIVVAVSGGFDPIHIGHVRMFERARALGNRLVVILNNDNWLRAKKQHIFMPDHERKEILEALRAVDEVVLTGHEVNPIDPNATPEANARKMSVSADLARIKPDIFANGGDRNAKNAADPTSSLYHDINTCKEIGAEMVFNIGDGGKIQSSSWLLADYIKKVSDKS